MSKGKRGRIAGEHRFQAHNEMRGTAFTISHCVIILGVDAVDAPGMFGVALVRCIHPQ